MNLAEQLSRVLSKRPYRVRVLFVDDEFVIQSFVQELALRLGNAAELKVAATVAEAREVLQKESAFTLVVLDAILTNGKGVELYRDIRNRWPRTKVIFLTGFDFEDISREVGQAGPAPIYHKPVAMTVDFFVDLLRDNLLQ